MSLTDWNNIEEVKNLIKKSIDHTLLAPTASENEIKKICDEAKTHQFFSVCINPSHVKFAKKYLSGSQVKICTVIGFPLGTNLTSTKAFETKEAIKDGAHEIDMVINIGLLKEKKYDEVTSDIKAVVDAANGNLVKVIFETCLLTDEEITKASECSIKAGAHFIKTSTGFSKEGATLHAVGIMKNASNGRAQIKASGGIRDFESAKTYLQAGATRLGTSSGVAILTGARTSDSY